MPSADTREKIVEAADRLFYCRGYEFTSFADIASAVSISRGNFYYHFKTKDEILDAVIARRLAHTDAMIAAWEAAAATPLERIRRYIRIMIENREQIVLYGCPVGTLTTELAKLNHPALDGANALFTLFRDWLATQFSALGHRSEAERLALHVIARSQGIATLASAFHDEAFIRREVADLEDWLEQTVVDTPPR